jgi:membrane protein involved in colicin uptake
MTTTNEKEKKGYEELEKTAVKQAKIMTLPLPQILDELESYIRRVEEAVKQAQTAAKESREAATQAKVSGEKAAEAARKAAEAAVAKVKEEAARAVDTLGVRVSGIESELNALKEKVSQEALAVDRAFLALKDKHIEDSPFLEK